MDRNSEDHGPRCMVCRRFFTPNPRLRDRQRCCGRENCRREYKNQWLREKYHSDVRGARAAVKLRVRRHRWNKRGQGAGISTADPPALSELQDITDTLAHLEATVNGLAARTSACRNGKELRGILASCAEYGRQFETCGARRKKNYL